MVSIVIFGLISTAVIVNLRSSSPAGEIRLQADNIASLLRQAQVQSYSGESFNGIVPTGGYGVYFATCLTPPCKVTLFADFNNNFTLDPADEFIQDISLGTQTTILNLSYQGPTAVVFKPPKPLICFNNTCSGIGEFRVTLGNLKDSSTVDVVVNQASGQISS